MNNLLSEEIFPLIEAADHIPTEPSISTLRRWCRVGLRGIKLESMTLAGRRVTSRQALLRFFTALDAPKAAPPRPVNPIQRPWPNGAPNCNPQRMPGLGIQTPMSQQTPANSGPPG